MAQGREVKTLLVSLLVTGAIVGAAGWWITRQPAPQSSPQSSVVAPTPVAPPPPTPANQQGQVPLSWGEQSLTEDSSGSRRRGINALAAGNYPKAVIELEAALADNPNDPEALIYLNNARIGQEQKYAIAVVVPAGTTVDRSKEILRGVAQAQNEMNQAGGINSRFLKVAIASDANDPALATQVAQTLVGLPDVLGVVGHFSSDASQAAARIYQNNGLVMISPTSTAVDLTAAGRFIFRTAPTDATAAKALARYQVETLNQTQAVVFYTSQSTYSESLRREFSEELIASGGQAIAEIDLSQTQNAAAALRQAQGQGAQVLVLFPNRIALDQSLQLINANRRQLPILAGDNVYSLKTLQETGANAQELVAAIPWHSQSQPNAPFVQTSQQLWGGDVSWRTAMAYDATQTFAQALQVDPSRFGVRAAIAAPTFTAPGASQDVSFIASGDRAQTVQLVQVQPGERSGTGFDFVPLNP